MNLWPEKIPHESDSWEIQLGPVSARYKSDLDQNKYEIKFQLNRDWAQLH